MNQNIPFNNISIRRKRRKNDETHSQEIKEGETKKQKKCEWVSKSRGIGRVLKYYWSILLKGDVVIGLTQVGSEEQQFSRESIFNEFKFIKQLVLIKSIGVLEVTLEQKSEGAEDYDKTIELLKNYPHITFRQIAQELEIHKKRMNLLKEISNNLKVLPQKEQLSSMIENSFILFKSQIQQQVLNMTQTGEIQAFKYNIFKMDYEKGNFSMTQCGSSQLLLAIIGLDTDQAAQFSLRKGIWQYIFHQDSFGMQKYFLMIQSGSIMNNSVSQVIIKTFDGIEMSISLRWRIIQNQDPLLIRLFGESLQHYAIIQCLEFTQLQLQFLKQQRQAHRGKFDFASLENEGDWQYSLEAQKFIQAFYDYKIPENEIISMDEDGIGEGEENKVFL